MIVGWTWLTVTGLDGDSPWLTPLYCAPLLALIILIYARLAGRLAGFLGASTKTNQGEDHEKA